MMDCWQLKPQTNKNIFSGKFQKGRMTAWWLAPKLKRRWKSIRKCLKIIQSTVLLLIFEKNIALGLLSTHIDGCDILLVDGFGFFFFLFFSNHMNQTSQLTFLKNSTHLFFSQLLSKSLGTCFSHQTLYEILHTRCDVVWQMSMWTMLMKCDFVVSSKNLDINCSARIDAGVQ